MELQVIEDLAKDLPPEPYRLLTYDYILTDWKCEEFPTGSIITCRSRHFVCNYHSNDVNFHTALLFWCSSDGSDRLSLSYEPHKTRPMISELRPGGYLLQEAGYQNRANEFAYKPRRRFLEHPRYLEVMSRIFKTLPHVYTYNSIEYSCMHKWQPSWFRDPDIVGYKKQREYYHELVKESNPQLASLRRGEKTAGACVDMCIHTISILHEELLINLTEDELAGGQTPAKSKILMNVNYYDASKLLSPSSEFYTVYETEATRFLDGTDNNGDITQLFVPFLPFILGALVFVYILLFARPMLSLFYQGLGVSLKALATGT